MRKSTRNNNGNWEGNSERAKKRDQKAYRKLMKQYAVSSNPQKVEKAKEFLSLLDFLNAIRANECRKMHEDKIHRYFPALFDYQIALEYSCHFIIPTVKQWEIQQAQKLHIANNTRQSISPDIQGLQDYESQVAIEVKYLRIRFSEIYPNYELLSDQQFDQIARSRVNYTNSADRRRRSYWAMDDYELFSPYIK